MKSLRRCNPRRHALLTVNPAYSFSAFTRRPFYANHNTHLEQEVVPLRKELKEEAKRLKREAKLSPIKKNGVDVSQWELTVGLEIHAELNTSRKLFTDAFASSGADSQPNSNIALFDLAYPGTQPHFQYATLLPALRSALALNCKIQRRSGWDRKHYFYQDQPNGYQITQYYGMLNWWLWNLQESDVSATEPFARDGHITLFRHDGIAAEDGESITIGITQVQMEQDTAKTIIEPPSDYLLDFNRVSHPLIEIITLPHIHHPSTAAACVKKIQSILRSVDACVAGMEIGGLRADVNVSVRRRNTEGGGVDREHGEYRGVTGLGQRTEIKNLSSFKAVEDAIIAERDRQIRVLESGGVVEGETRRWTLGSTETEKLRGKEGEVDYRYMPDPDLEPLIISNELVEYLRKNLSPLPDDMLTDLTKAGLTVKDAQTLLAHDEVERLEYYFDLVEDLRNSDPDVVVPHDLGRIVGNWVLHELGSLFTKSESSWSAHLVPTSKLADLLRYLMTDKIITRSAKQILEMVFYGDPRSVDAIVQEENMAMVDIPEEEYETVAKSLIQQHGSMVEAIKTKGQKGKVMWFVGQMLRELGQSAQAEKAKQIICRLLDVPVDSSSKPKRK